MLGFAILLVACNACWVCSSSENTRLLIGGMFPMDGRGWSGGVACLPAVQMALQDVNNQTGILSGYTLELMPVNSKCLPGLSLSKMYELLYDNKTKLVLMTGCSSVSTFVAQAAPKWNLIVLSYGSSSPALSDRSRFPTFFRTHPSATLHNPTRVKLFNRFDWKQIATIQQTEEVFTSTIKDLEERIKQEANSGLEITVRQSFQTDPTNAVKSLARQDARIIVGVFYEDMARKVFCEAFKEGLFGKRYVWLIIGWYPNMWYEVDKERDGIDCTTEELKLALEGHLTTEVMQLIPNEDRTDTAITTKEFVSRLQRELSSNESSYDCPGCEAEKVAIKDPMGATGYVEAPFAYDAVWALSYALDKTIKKSSAEESERLEKFSYENTKIKDAIFSSMKETDFVGISGRVTFTSTGDRIAKTQIEQMQDGVYKIIGYYNYLDEFLDWKGGEKWPGGLPPKDRTVEEKRLEIILPNLTYTTNALAGLGVAFCFVALVFNMYYRQYSTVVNSMATLNSIIALGCIISLCSVPLFSLDGRVISADVFTKICQIRTWVSCVGFTLSFGAMFVKIFISWRVFKVAKNSTVSSGKVLDLADCKGVHWWEPYVFFVCMLLCDLIVLSVWQAIDPFYRTLEDFPAIEPDPNSDEDIRYLPQLEHCECKKQAIWLGIVYGYKGMLLVCGLFLAYETRSVKIRGINDLHLLAMAVYNVVVSCVIAIPVTLIIPHQQNASFMFVAAAVILSCYLAVGLLFIPKMMQILRKRIDMDEEETQQSLMHHEQEKQYKQLHIRNEALKKEIAKKEQRILELHAIIHSRLSNQLVTDEKSRTSDSAFSEENSNNGKNESVMLNE